MSFDLSRRGFLGGLAGFTVIGSGCIGMSGPVARSVAKSQKVRLAAVGIMGKGYSDWTPMLKTGRVKIVAFCDADYSMREKAQLRLAKDGIDFDMYEVP